MNCFATAAAWCRARVRVVGRRTMEEGLGVRVGGRVRGGLTCRVRLGSEGKG